MADEQELLSEISWLILQADIYRRPLPTTKWDELAKDIIAKLKAMGYEQAWINCPCCGSDGEIYDPKIEKRRACPMCEGTGKITKYVKWDREKVIDSLHWTEYSFIGRGNRTYKGVLKQKSEEQIADQLKEILTGGE